MLVDIGDTPAGTGPDVPAPAGPVMRAARAARTRWRARSDLPARCSPSWVSCWAAARFCFPGVLLLLVALLHGLGSSGCTSADQLAGWPWRG